MRTNKIWSCLECKRLADRDHKKGLVGKYLLSSMITFNSKKEAINHLKISHPSIYKKLFAKESSHAQKEQKSK